MKKEPLPEKNREMRLRGEKRQMTSRAQRGEEKIGKNREMAAECRCMKRKDRCQAARTARRRKKNGKNREMAAECSCM